MGTIYMRGKTYWIKYSKNGKPFYESAQTDKKMVASALLKQREGDIAQGKIPGVLFERVKFDDLAEDFLTDYRINGRKSLQRAQISVNTLKVHFGGMRATDVTTQRINTYVEKRMEAGAANGTINRELAALKRMLNLGARSTPPKVDRVPYITMLKETNVRQGFFEHHEFISLRDALPPYLKPVVTFGYRTGWRKSEIYGLQWTQVDLAQGTVRLNTGETKNDRARLIYVDDETKKCLEDQWAARRDGAKITPYVFPNADGNGPIKDARGAWDAACNAAGIGKRLLHDFRRTAVRNMIRAGIPERVAMMVSGHQTRSVFDRYNIVSDDDLKLAARKQADYLETMPAASTVTKTVTIADFGKGKEAQKMA
jgi:integrase